MDAMTSTMLLPDLTVGLPEPDPLAVFQEPEPPAYLSGTLVIVAVVGEIVVDSGAWAQLYGVQPDQVPDDVRAWAARRITGSWRAQMDQALVSATVTADQAISEDDGVCEVQSGG